MALPFVEPIRDETLSHALEPIVNQGRLSPKMSFSLPWTRAAVFGPAPGPDGFSGAFFTACWEIVKHDVHQAVLDFFMRSSLPRAYTSSFLVLIPKIEKATRIKDYRPISLCQFTRSLLVCSMTGWLHVVIT